jgi:hypothetical protein
MTRGEGGIYWDYSAEDCIDVIENARGAIPGESEGNRGARMDPFDTGLLGYLQVDAVVPVDCVA